MDTTTLVFIILSVLGLVAAYRVVTSPNIMHSALWLGFTFVVIAGVFLLLNAEFLAAAQVLVYVGAVTTIIVFGIMLSESEELKGRPEGGLLQRLSGFAALRRGVLPVVAAVGFAAVMLRIYGRAGLRDLQPVELGDTTAALGRSLFGPFVIPFELAAVVLLVALVGAIVIATKEGRS